MSVKVPMSGGVIEPFPNGMAWTKISQIEAQCLEYGNGLWVKGTLLGLLYSNDLATWEQSNLTGDMRGTLCFSNGLWVCASQLTSTGLWWSADGKTWTQSNITSGTCNIGGISQANGMWQVGLSSGVYYSTDGKTWTRSNLSRGGGHSCFGNGLWVCVGSGTSSSNYGIYSSTNGTSWTKRVQGDFDRVFYANGIWQAGGHYETPTPVRYSTDGITWSTGNISTAQTNSFNYANGIWEMTNENGIYHSSDGKTWTISNITESCDSILNAGGIWCAGTAHYTTSTSTATKIFYSQNGMDWTEVIIEARVSAPTLHHENGIWVAGDIWGIWISPTWEP